MDKLGFITNCPVGLFYIQNETETQILMENFAQFLIEKTQNSEDSLIRRIAFVGDPKAGKTTSITSLFNGLGEQEIYEYTIDFMERRPQTLRYVDAIGWVRQYDAALNATRPRDRKFQAAADPEFWNIHGYGLDIVEHPAEDSNKTYDYLFQINVANNHRRTISLCCDPSLASDPLLLKFIRKAHEEIEKNRYNSSNQPDQNIMG